MTIDERDKTTRFEKHLAAEFPLPDWMTIWWRCEWSWDDRDFERYFARERIQSGALMRMRRDKMTRAQIARETGLTMSAISKKIKRFEDGQKRDAGICPKCNQLIPSPKMPVGP